MKKLISICLALVMLLTVFPLSAFAAENTESEYDQLMALACEVFPEFAPTIEAANANTYSRAISSTDYSVVHSETRNVSDNESMTLALLASGDVIAIKNDTSTTEITIPNQSTTDITTVGVSGTATFKFASSLESGCSAKLSNVGFTIWYYDTSRFTSYGTPTYSGFYYFNRESASESKIVYNIGFGPLGSGMIVQVELYFENGQLVVYTH